MGAAILAAATTTRGQQWRRGGSCSAEAKPCGIFLSDTWHGRPFFCSVNLAGCVFGFSSHPSLLSCNSICPCCIPIFPLHRHNSCCFFPPRPLFPHLHTTEGLVRSLPPLPSHCQCSIQITRHTTSFGENPHMLCKAELGA